ncbi:MAG: hypothetical protein ACLQJ0_14440 [Steroidobacteraceae bacterium]|jgi:hypothetical protein
MKQRTSVIALVVVLHLAAVWLLIWTTLRFRTSAASTSLELLVLATPSAAPPEAAPSPRDEAVRAERARPQPAPAEPSAANPEAAQENNAIHPPIDWDGELDRAARDAASVANSPQPREFGFPQAASPAPKAPEFAWSRTHTHRVDILPDGGMLVNISSHCAIIINPFPFPICGLGKTPANGDLFEHMRDPAQAGDWDDPH